MKSLNFKIIFFMLLVASCNIITGCKKLVEVKSPVTSTNQQNVYQYDATAISVLTALYSRLSTNSLASGNQLSSFMSLYPGLEADELTLSGIGPSSLKPWYQNQLVADINPDVWLSSCYSNIYVANAVIEGVSSSGTLTPAVKKQLLGEAKFFRAFNYFYLVNLYGAVPLVLTTNYQQNSLLSRTAPDGVYQQIIADLLDAQSNLNSNYVGVDCTTPTTDRLRPNKWTANALLSRVYLYIGEYDKAEAQATLIINNTDLFELASLNDVFKANSREAIWQLQPVNLGYNTEDARYFIIPITGLNVDNPVYLSKYLLSAFEVGDLRKSKWIGTYINTTVTPNQTFYYPYKYKNSTLNVPVTEYKMVFRLGEQYLIRAEAKANQGDLLGAEKDLDIIRSRAGLNGIAVTSKSDLLAAISKERQVELFTEWGDRWLDLKRTGKIDSVMTRVTPEKGNTWSSYQQLQPISKSELTNDHNLIQNPGY